MGRIAFGSKVAVGAFGKGVSVLCTIGVGVSFPEKGWKGVRVGVAFGGTVTRNKVVGEAAGTPTVEFPDGAAQPVKKRMSTDIRSVRRMSFLLLVSEIPIRPLVLGRRVGYQGLFTALRRFVPTRE